MSESILNKLEASRKELLDLGLRNPLLNYKMPMARGLQIVQEQSASVYDILVAQGKAMTFLEKLVKTEKIAPGKKVATAAADAATGNDSLATDATGQHGSNEGTELRPAIVQQSKKTKPVAARTAELFDPVEDDKAVPANGATANPQNAAIEDAGQPVAAIPEEEYNLPPVTEETITDTKLQTNEPDLQLQRRLLNTYYDARTSIEEQGVNILYLSLGMLHWYEADNSEELRRAPLVLVPVTLDRSSARERFRLRYTLEEMGANISLQAKMKAEFGIVLPDMVDPDDFTIGEYFQSIEKAIDAKARWQVVPDEIELGFFSFGKFMIYSDLDSNKWPTDKKPAAHTIVSSLLGDGFIGETIGIEEDAHIDEDTSANDLFQVVDADSSQLMAMLAVNEGRNLVVQGPPGTGKSQTITNIIANAIGQGKKVLFVAEKMAALEVVKRRLDNIHLGEACLELHSHKANKKELHQELRRVLELGKPTQQQWQQQVTLLEAQKAELNTYCYAINTPVANSGLTIHQVFGYLLEIREQLQQVEVEKIPLEDIAAWDAARMSAAESLALRIQARLKEIGVPASLLFYGSGLQVLMPNGEKALLTSFAAGEQRAGEAQAVATEGAAHVGVPAPTTAVQAADLVSWLKLLSLQPLLQGMAIAQNDWLLYQADIEELIATGKQLVALRDQYKDIFIPEAWQQDVMTIRQHLLLHGRKWYKFVISDYNRSNKLLGTLCKAGLPDTIDEKLAYVEAILEGKRLEAELAEHEGLAASLFGPHWKNLKTDWNVLEAASRYLLIVHKQIAARTAPVVLLDYLQTHRNPQEAKHWHDQLYKALDHHKQSVADIIAGLKLDESLRFGAGGFLQMTFEKQAALFQTWQQRLPELHQVIQWNGLVETAATQNLLSLVHTATYWEQAKDLLHTALRKTWFEYLYEQAVLANPSLRKFERASHEEVIQQFRQTDKLNLQYNRARVAARHWESMPRLEAGGQVNTLRKEFNKKARHIPIRKLIEEAGIAIQAIKPVFMMSPLSIANFLPPGSVEFDLVIFDEASQVRPVEALGAILRGKQLIVVGDTKQLPPTSFFDNLSAELEDEDNVTADLQSILGMCDAQGSPQRMLRWHYRSRHESLITLSNHAFYENKLVIFPSPGSRSRMGLVFHHLKDTVYDRGKTRANQKEAEAVADAVLDHARKSPKLSLGVAAFSMAQKQAIQDALELRRRKHPELEPYFAAHTDEPFFVKNLENVQGDERDVIFISIGYGRAADRSVSMSFGPLNNEGGERRLNVLITRAKLRCEVFTNITADDIDISRTQKYSIKALKSFLYYAQHGRLDQLEKISGLPADSPFEEMVADRLAAHGYTVRRQVGSAGYYLDLAVVDTDHPGRYLLGIECDGAAYHSARSARDRDRLRQQVLESMGWRIYRIWSADWFRNPEREWKRLAEAIEQARAAQHQEDDAWEEQEQAAPLVLQRESMPEQAADIPDYVFATVPEAIASQEIHLHATSQLSVWIEEIVKIESPVHFDEVARRIIEAAGVARVGPRIRESLVQAVKYATGNLWIRVSEDFLWYQQSKIPQLRDRSNLPASVKKLKYIAPEEMILAIEKVVRDSVAIPPEAAVPFVARIFGFNRVTEDMKAEIIGMIGRALAQGTVYQEGDYLKITN
ncbi:DUF3320 domain-containing protein [Paraflavitalea pollutisoli]|uniref:DUF3320 domain-containing protein n=1 Tax=Paraflavitalea pollutisoli TaxID=3034143 RepID=UPI0023ED963D|nr:DUF3320 domain-containing protein [Paraflavitalea sp. H1-2-19X]